MNQSQNERSSLFEKPLTDFIEKSLVGGIKQLTDNVREQFQEDPLSVVKTAALFGYALSGLKFREITGVIGKTFGNIKSQSEKGSSSDTLTH